MRSRQVDLGGATIVLTGATRGIGRALCRLLVARGATVAAIARDEAGLAAIQDELGEQCVPFPCDLSVPSSRDTTIDALERRLGTVDGLINNAGVQTEMSHIDGNAAEVSGQSAREIGVNLIAPVHLITKLLPLMPREGAPFVVNLTSGLAIAPKEAAPVYSATKAGLRSFTRALRYQAQSARTELRVIEVIMALVDTDMTEGRGQGKISAERAAKEILNGILKGKQEVWVGKTKLLPWLERVSPQIPARILR